MNPLYPLLPQDFVIWCADMATAAPKEYIALPPSTSGNTFSERYKYQLPVTVRCV